MHDVQPVPSPPPFGTAATRPIAHWTHTLALFLLLTVTTFYGHSRATSIAGVAPNRIGHYISTIMFEWLLLGAVIAGIYLRRDFFLASFRSRLITTPQTFGLGLATYISGTLAIAVVSGLLYFTPLFHQRNTEVVLALLPHTPLEFLLWFCVSATAGITEEIIFRGYLQQQITAWTQRPLLSVVIGALLFGSVHLYEGLGAILPLAALAVVYGLVVRHFKGDLRAVIIAHTLQDFLIAFIVLLRPIAEKYQQSH